MKPVILSIVSAVMIVTASACAPNIATRGNLPDPDKLAEIIPGEASRDDVADLLGSPSSAATFGDETWYYIATRVETVAFNEPEVIDQQVVAIKFGEDGLVTAIDTYGLDDARAVGNRRTGDADQWPRSHHPSTATRQRRPFRAKGTGIAPSLFRPPFGTAARRAPPTAAARRY